MQECGSARFVRYYITAALLSHYAVSSIDDSSRSRIYDPPNLLITETIVQECGFARTINYITAAPPSHYAVSSIDGSSQSQLCNLLTGVVARRSNHPQAFYLLSDVCSHTFWLNECDYSRSSNFILGASLEAKLELEIHLVSSISFVGFKAECAYFIVISSQIGLRTLNVVYGSGACHLRLLPFKIPTSSYTMLKETTKEKEIFVEANFEDAKTLAQRGEALYLRIFAIKKLLKKLETERESVDLKFKDIVRSLSHLLVHASDPYE
ncbi:unnamed protein product [Brassica oleracea var. botrytis]